jgi:hypothetical protein
VYTEVESASYASSSLRVLFVVALSCTLFSRIGSHSTEASDDADRDAFDRDRGWAKVRRHDDLIHAATPSQHWHYPSILTKLCITLESRGSCSVRS